jgi:hypothetical protein
MSGCSSCFSDRLFVLLVRGFGGRHALFPPEGEEEKSKAEQGGRHDRG